MKISERSYSTKLMRPKPVVHVSDDGALIAIVTPWGQPEHAQRAIDEISKYMNAAKADVEVTSPFEFLSCLPDQVNYVRTAILLANETLYRGENKSEYVSGVEVLVLFRSGHQVSWAQVGAPGLFLKKEKFPLQPISAGLDLAVELGKEENLSPLPPQLLGLEPACDIKTGHFYVNDGDQIVVLASGRMTEGFWEPSKNPSNLQEWTKLLVGKNPDLPFWLGVISLSE